jgi:YHS domain-containing protein
MNKINLQISHKNMSKLLNGIITLLFPFSVLVLLSGCASTGQIINTDKNSYGLIANSSYNGNLITIDKNTRTLEYNGRLYYFNNKMDLEKFQSNPEKYIDMHDFNNKPRKIKPLVSDYGLHTDSSYNGDPIVISAYSPTLEYLGRIYYFAHHKEAINFIANPLIFLAKYPSNKVPKDISPLKSDYGKKSICSGSGIPILIGPHTPTLEYMGRVFYFSSLFEMQTFQQDPQAYIAKEYNQQ